MITDVSISTNDSSGSRESKELSPRPLFSAGQLLYETDLNALSDWTSGRFVALRDRIGWGVVNGLRVLPATGQANAVRVTPGLSVMPDGSDVKFTDQRAGLVVVNPPQPDRDDGCASILVESGSEKNDSVKTWSLPGGLEVKANKPLVFDLLLTYEEKKDRDLRPIPQNPSGPPLTTAKRVAARMNIVISFTQRPVNSNVTEPDVIWKRRHDDWAGDLGPLLEKWKDPAFVPSSVQLKTLAERQAKADLSDLGVPLKSSELTLFGDLLKQVGEGADDVKRKKFWGLALLMAIDERTRLYRGQAQAETGKSVPLARVYCDQTDQGIRVLFVDDNPPFRRAFGPDDNFPAPAGKLNLARYFGQTFGKEIAAISPNTLLLKEPTYDLVKAFVLQAAIVPMMPEKPGTWGILDWPAPSWIVGFRNENPS